MSSESRIEDLRGKFGAREHLYLLSFWVGPVQEFIQEARKVRDLWTGSYLLAKATFEAMKPCLDNPDCEILLPDVKDSPLYKSWKGCLDNLDSLAYACLPNHFVALTSAEHLEDITEGVRSHLEQFLPCLASKIKEDLEEQANLTKNYPQWDSTKLWDFQVNDHFQLMWVGFPIKFEDLESTDKYKERFNDLQRLMEERKLTRTFKAWQGVPVDKCSQCGRREILTPAPHPVKREVLRNFWNSIRRTDRARYKIKDAEQLCTVCLVKRLIKDSEIDPALKLDGFESTSDIASRPYRKILTGKRKNAEVAAFLETVKLLAEVLGPRFKKIKNIDDVPGDWLYEEGLRYERLRREHSVPDSKSTELKTEADKARAALNRVYEALGQKPCKYYAIVILDADEMGKYIAGKNMPPGESFNLDWQYEQSRILSELANMEFIKIVKQYDGQTIYSGGDDLLAFGPLEGVFRTVEELRTKFKSNIDTTTSAAVVIVHHQDPLQWAICEATQALERAKERYNRKSIATSVRLSSGNYLTCGSHWELKLDNSSSNVSLLNNFLLSLVTWMSAPDKGLSTAFVNDLTSEIGVFYKDDRLSADMFKLEIRRLFQRHLPEQSPIWKKELSTIETVQNSLVHLGDPHKQDFKDNHQENITAILKLAAFLAREEKAAEKEP
jgi:CRISPR-associated protein Cmr2